jgi:integral membrane protein
MAYVVGVLLLALTLSMLVKYGADSPGAVRIVAPAHGLMFMVYLVTTLQLALARRWPTPFTLLVMLSGAVPVLSFVMERRVSRREFASPAQRAPLR